MMPKCSHIIPVTRVLSEVKKVLLPMSCYTFVLTHTIHVCIYTNITAVDTKHQCVLTMWLHTPSTSSYYASTQVLGPLNIKWKKHFFL